MSSVLTVFLVRDLFMHIFRVCIPQFVADLAGFVDDALLDSW